MLFQKNCLYSHSQMAKADIVGSELIKFGFISITPVVTELNKNRL